MKTFLDSRLFDEAGEGTGAGGGSTFDPVAFKAELLADLRKDLNGISKSLKTDISKSIKDILTAGSGGQGQGQGEGQGSGNGQQGQGEGQQGQGETKIDPALNARLQALERTNKTLADEVTAAKKAREEAENKQRETSRQSTIRDVLAGIEFRDDAARKDAYKVIAGDIAYDEDGNLVASTDKGAVSAEEHIKAYFADNSRAYMLAPKGGGGSGARPGTRQNGGGYTPRITDDITKLTPEQREVYRQHVATTMLEAQSGAQ